MLRFYLTNSRKENIIDIMKINISQIKDDQESKGSKESLIIKKKVVVPTKKKEVGPMSIKLEKKEGKEVKEKVKINIKGKESLASTTPIDDVVIIGKQESAPVLIKEKTNQGRQGLILIAEDEKPLSRALEIKLAKEGYDVMVASNGEEAIRHLSGKVFDLIILDLVMPKRDGFAVLEYLNKEGMKSSIIVLSNLAQEEDFKKARDLGAMTYFIKSNTPIIELIRYIKENI
ncbi:MAG: Alkaline phosphatase synthesis transcriptional regulatory protein PhoP [Parcubacteria group bacterium ADurb.Bin216]|jgi:CheY-like chemotaxis protein|nr:MAG: Alkaline phosphatase synthesis transcriptional regulatory protein PhoP [Parcubacteria group bacterium ADurb.Bin216]